VEQARTKEERGLKEKSKKKKKKETASFKSSRKGLEL
jgi:hypothetical protein